jgi:hypothetical protein
MYKRTEICTRAVPPRQYHYTDLIGLEGIMLQGHIKTSDWGDEDGDDYWRICNVSWASAALVWEPAAYATLAVTDWCDEAVKLMVEGEECPVARIEVDTGVLHEWSACLARIGVSPYNILYLAQRGYECGCDPENWAVSPIPIEAASWLRVQVWNGDDWICIQNSPDPEHRRLASMVPDHCIVDGIDEQSPSGRWIAEVRGKGCGEWVEFTDSRFSVTLEAMAQGRQLTNDELVELIKDDDSLNSTYRLLTAIQCAPEDIVYQLANELGGSVLRYYDYNPNFARAVSAYYGVTLGALTNGIRRIVERAARSGVKAQAA